MPQRGQTLLAESCEVRQSQKDKLRVISLCEVQRRQREEHGCSQRLMEKTVEPVLMGSEFQLRKIAFWMGCCTNVWV